MKKATEICCGGYADARAAMAGGAGCIELNCALHLGGLTPSIGTLQLVKENTDLHVVCMVRPRGGGFHYQQGDIDTMFKDAELLLENGADGIVFGFLHPDATIDTVNSRKMIQLAHAYQKEAVFHRAFDATSDLHEATQTLVELQCDRILTSGGCPTALEGADTLACLNSQYGDCIEFVMGCGVNDTNVKKLVQATGIWQAHSSCKSYRQDDTTTNGCISYRYLDNDSYEVVDREKVAAFVEAFSRV